MRPEPQMQLDRLAESMRLMHEELSERMFLVEHGGSKYQDERGDFRLFCWHCLCATVAWSLLKLVS